jgi:hypothetical protein
MISRNAKLKKIKWGKGQTGKDRIVGIRYVKRNFHTSLLRVLGQRLIFGWYEAKYNIMLSRLA